ncbi:MAG: amidase [Aestuariivita sp.]|nr:amidase [Aestuariivita sp.]
MANKPTWQWSANEIIVAIRKKKISAVEVIESICARMDAINPQLNAVVESLADKAIARARVLDQSSSSDKPLYGIPITIKINIDQVGFATSNGLPALKDFIADQDAPFVKNMEDAGAIVIGRTNTPEFSFRADTDNPLHGRTFNPWGRHISAGGSSGGAGAAVIAGIGALAHGNDIGGSLRFPASANGAVTVKPGLSRVPAWNPSQKSTERGLLAQSMSVQGLITRTAEDLHLAMPIAIKHDPRDPFHAPLPWRGDQLPRPIKVGYCKDDFGLGIHPDVTAALDAAAKALEDAGFVIEEVNPPLAQECGEVAFRTLMGEVNALMSRDIETLGSDELQSIFDEYYQLFPPYEGSELIRMMAQRSHYARQWSLFLEKYPLVLTPFLLQPFFGPGRDTEGSEGVREVMGHSLWSYVFNFTGLPAGNLPTRITKLNDGLQPIGVQIAGRRWREDLIVDAMVAIEQRIKPACHTLWETMNTLDEKTHR